MHRWLRYSQFSSSSLGFTLPLMIPILFPHPFLFQETITTMLSKKCAPEKFQFARTLRKNSTPAEHILWQQVRKKLMGVRVRRQSVILGFIADFYCPKARLVIEVDGSAHDPVRDAERDAVFNKHGFEVMRFTNIEVVNHTAAVAGLIQSKIKSRMEMW
jgi:very-short-patch-repair endonuclease